MATFCVCPFKMHLRPDSEDGKSCCAQGEKNYFAGEFVFPVQAIFAFSGLVVQEWGQENSNVS